MVKNSKRSTMQFRPSVKPGMEKKDLATPRHSNDTRRRRVARRAAKFPTKSGKVQVKLQLNCISSLLAGVRKPTNAFERCLYKDALTRAHSVKAVSFVENTLFACGACAAKQGRDCICSGVAFLYARVDKKQLTEFISGVRSPYNPVYEPSDPDDQEKLQAALEVGVSLLPESSSPLVRCRHLLRLVYVAAMTGLASTVHASAAFLVKSNLAGLRCYLDTADVVHRGGQHPGKICRGEIAVHLVAFMRTVGNKIALLLSSCTTELPCMERRKRLLRSVILIFKLVVKKEYKVDGCGVYKCKRLVDVIMLAGLSSKILVPHFKIGDLLSLAGMWPLPDGSRRGLRKIMPGMTTKVREQQALKAIALTLGSGGNGKSVPACTISAMLCFWNEHKNKDAVLQWVPEWA